ncbi:hypothetical protein Q4555_03605 [Octadecabacter sp. 1_MG-2023]|uniref:hypothetical protein n=1 Tax=unclassified Octadecabacter TaxID=196158 RepID=UPI001C09DB53|nr:MULTISPECIES: hypothetical protein [unclassified Octadecabacter]MBU2992810.1 hypothetical protein [Octadecabacter sp. B2R22]MDO6733739.1 hypothetical protein [Octadecabacter sp. 1_MG-2023]
MSRIITALSIAALLAGCDGKNPFQDEVVATNEETGETELVDDNDPNTDVDNKFAYDPERNLTMNSVDYDDNGTPNDPTDDTVVINNLPFDGPDGVYDDIAGADTTNADGQTTNIFQNTENTISGEIQYYAVMVRSDFLEASSAASEDWTNFGFAGANVNRESYVIPDDFQGSYVYAGVYAATRTYDERGGLELIRGDATLRLDVPDIDPLDGLQGTIAGNITNRTRDGIGDQMVGDLPDISLRTVTFNTDTGVWEDGDAGTYDYVNGDRIERDSGTYDGLIAGTNGEELGGYLIVEGVADIQTVEFEVVIWEDIDGNINETNGYDVADAVAIQTTVNNGNPVGLLSVTGGIDIPATATVLSTTTETIDIQTDYNAREIGVFVTDLQP